MNKFIALVIVACLGWAAALPAEVAEESLTQEPFGKLTLYRPDDKPKGLLLFISGADGWNADRAALARQIAELDYLVAGVDLSAYLPKLDSATGCGNPAADFDQLGRLLAERYPLPAQAAPIIMGYGVGAALTYAALAQAPAATFHAGVSIDFCPRLPLRNNLCQIQALTGAPPAGGNVSLQPSGHLPTGWFVFQRNPACDPAEAERFTDRVDNARQLTFSAQDDGWRTQLIALLQWLDPEIHGQVQTDAGVAGLPLIEVKAADAAGKRLAVILTGDGGWAELDRTVAAELAGRGIPVVGWDSLSYFWKAKTPEQTGQDMAKTLQHYLKAWDKDEVILIGYSFGAEVLPFMANRLPPDLRERVKLVALLSPSPHASFEFHLTDWLDASPGEDALPVAPEIKKLDWVKRLCIYGADEDEEDTVCPSLTDAGVVVLKVPGDHHFDEDYAGVTALILAQTPP